MIEKAYVCPSGLVNGIFNEAKESRGGVAGKPFTYYETIMATAVIEFLAQLELAGTSEQKELVRSFTFRDSNLKYALVKLIELI